jgi:hypothetical protein
MNPLVLQFGLEGMQGLQELFANCHFARFRP